MKTFIVYPGNNSFVIRESLLKRGNWKEIQFDDPNINIADVDFIWSPNNLSTKEYEKIIDNQKKNPNHKLLVNHFENNNSLTTKSDMIKALNQYYKKNLEAVKGGYNVFHSIPASYVLVVGVNTVDSRDFQIKYNEIQKANFKRCTLPEKHCAQNVWILKPENQSQGKGIEIFQNLKNILSFLHYKPAFSKWVIQKYIERPLLYNGRKFDLRVWVLYTNKGELFVYKDGYLRTSSSKYSMHTFNDAIHLTNWSLQKGMQNYEKHEQGNRLPLKEGLQCIFDNEFSRYNVDYEKHIYPRMKDLIIDLIRSCEGEMFQSKKLNNCFELYGFDFIIDEDLRVWLIEANRNPGFGLPTEKAKKLIDEMVDEMLKITVDNIFTPKISQGPRQNVFDLIYTMKPSAFNKFQPKNDRRSFNLNIYPIQELEPKTNTGEKRFQVLNPLQEKDYWKIIEKQQILDNDMIAEYKASQGRHLAYPTQLNKVDSNKEGLSNLYHNDKEVDQIQGQKDIQEVEVDVEIEEVDKSQIDVYNEQRGRQNNNIDKPISRTQMHRDSNTTDDNSIKQISLDQHILQPIQISQSQNSIITQRIQNLVLTSPMILDPLPHTIKPSEQKELEFNKSDNTFKPACISPTVPSKIMLEPINPNALSKVSRNQALFDKNSFNHSKTNLLSSNFQNNQKFHYNNSQPNYNNQSSNYNNLQQNQHNQNRQQQNSNNFNKTSINNFSMSPNRQQFINRSYNRSLVKIRQLNEQAQQSQQFKQIQNKGYLAKTLSSSQFTINNNNSKPNYDSQILTPKQSPLLQYSQNQENETKKQSNEQKEISMPQILPMRDKHFYSTLNSPQSTFSQISKIRQ